MDLTSAPSHSRAAIIDTKQKATKKKIRIENICPDPMRMLKDEAAR